MRRGSSRGTDVAVCVPRYACGGMGHAGLM